MNTPAHVLVSLETYWNVTCIVNSFSLIEPIEFIPRIGGLGLGATPRAPPPEKKNRIKKPGEDPKKVLGPYIDKDGRVKHVKKIGEEIPQQPLQGVDNNTCMIV